MDYTTRDLVIQEMHSVLASGSSVDDTLIDTLITAASRAWDRKCTGVPDAIDYFVSGSVSGEVLVGQISSDGTKILCYPHKPIIDSVSSFSFQENITKTAYTVDPTRIEVYGPRVTAYPANLSLNFPSKCRVTIGYVGGLGASVTDLPPDMVEAVTLLAIRFYKESETGLADQMAIAELAQNIYTKAWPIRVQETAEFYRRKVGWRNVA